MGSVQVSNWRATLPLCIFALLELPSLLVKLWADRLVAFESIYVISAGASRSISATFLTPPRTSNSSVWARGWHAPIVGVLHSAGILLS